MTWTLTQREYSNLKRRLTRVLNEGNHDKIIAECKHALAIFEDKGWPDDHFRWQRALEDAEFAKKRASFSWSSLNLSR